LSVRRIIIALAAVAIAAALVIAAVWLMAARSGPGDDALAEWLGGPGRADLSFPLATVDGDEITRREFYDYVVPPREPGKLYTSLWPNVARQAANDLLRDLAIEMKARAKGIAVKRRDLEVRYSELLSRMTGTPVVFDAPEAERALRGVHIPEIDFRRQVAIMLLTEGLMAAEGLDVADPFEEGAARATRSYVDGLVVRAEVVSDPAKLPENVAMIVGDERVTRHMLARQVLAAAGPRRAGKALDHLVSRRIIERAFAEAGLELGPADEKFHVEYLKGTFRALPELRGSSFPGKVEELRLNSMLTRLARERVTPEKITAALAENPTRYGRGQREVAHIFLGAVDAVTERRLTDEELAALGERIKAIHADLSSRKARFEVVAKKVNGDGTELRRGSLGWLARGDYSAELSAAAYSLAIGAISAPVRDARGWHIVKPLRERTLPDKEARWLAECGLLVKLRGEIRRALYAGANVVRSAELY